MVACTDKMLKEDLAGHASCSKVTFRLKPCYLCGGPSASEYRIIDGLV